MPTASAPVSRSSIVYPKSRAAVIDLWRSLGAKDAVCFDVDSTVVAGEFIDELAEYCGVGERVQQLTRSAMGGSVNFRTALRDRLNIIRPSAKQVEEFTYNNPLKLTPGIRSLMETLQARGVSCYLVSGGFEKLIFPVAATLNIPNENVMANKLFFDEDGNYTGFDETEPTSVSGGKALAVSAIRERADHRHVIMIGDGATDAEACPPANAFIGFGGNVMRESVRSKCFYYALSFHELVELMTKSVVASAAISSPVSIPSTTTCSHQSQMSQTKFGSPVTTSNLRTQ